MKNLTTSLLFLLLLWGGMSPASVSIDWLKTGESIYKNNAMVARDGNDNVFVTGYTTNGSIYTRKYDILGNFLWEAVSTSDIFNNYERSTWITIDPSGDIIVMGMRYILSSSFPYPTGVIILKYDQNGNQLWKQQVTGTFGTGSSSSMVVNFDERCFTDASGNIYAGASERFPSSSPGFNAIKISPAGDILWNIKFNNGSQYYDVNGSRLNADGTFVLTGSSAPSSNNTTTVAFDANGNVIWSNTVNGFSGTDVLFDTSGKVYVLTTYSASAGLDFVLLKYTATGTLIWTKFYDFGSAEIGRRMALTADNNLVLTGVGSQLTGMPYVDWVTVKVDLNGNSLWTNRYNQHQNNDEMPWFIAADDLSNVYITGTGGPYPGGSTLSYLQMVTLKYTASGVEEWAAVTDSTTATGLGIAIASDRSLFVAGQSMMTLIHYLDFTGSDPCSVPVNLSLTALSNSSATIKWDAVANAYLYHVQYKTSGATSWNMISTDGIPFTLTNLLTGTSYDYRVEAICNSGPTGYSAIQQFTTSGSAYCISMGLNATKEWIDVVWLGGIFNGTGSNNGYADFTNLTTDLVQGSTNTITLSAGMGGGVYNETWRVWIDYNHDGDFIDQGEKEVAFKSNAIGWTIKSFVVPNNAVEGVTRMRVSMKKGTPAQTPCEIFARGEVEDYTVNILPSKMETEVVMNNAAVKPEIIVYPNPASNMLHVNLNNWNGMIQVSVFDITGKQIYFNKSEAGNTYEIYVAQWMPGIYFLRVTDGAGNSAAVKWMKE